MFYFDKKENTLHELRQQKMNVYFGYVREYTYVGAFTDLKAGTFKFGN